MIAQPRQPATCLSRVLASISNSPAAMAWPTPRRMLIAVALCSVRMSLARVASDLAPARFGERRRVIGLRRLSFGMAILHRCAVKRGDGGRGADLARRVRSLCH